MSVINCLLYNGSHAATDDVQGTLNALNTPDFKVTTATSINAKTLIGIDVLIVPGGDGGLTYLECGDFNEKDIQNFIYNGGRGYFDCAASYDAAKQSIGVKNYVGWGVAPTIIANGLTDDEPNGVLIKVLNILGITGIFTINHFQGPYFTDPTNTMTIFAVFADNQTGHQGSAAIVGEKYGKGYSILDSVHPENREETYSLLQNLIKLTYNGGNPVISADDYDNKQNYPILNSDMNLMIQDVTNFKKVNNRNPNIVYLRLDGKVQVFYVTWSKYTTLLGIWNTFINLNKRQPNYIYINTPPAPQPEPTGYVRIPPYDYYFQQTDYWCGPTSWMMVLSTYDIYPLNNSEQDCLNDPYDAENIVAGIAGTQMNDNGTAHQGMLDVATHYNLAAQFVSLTATGIQGLENAINSSKRAIVNIMTGDGNGWEFPQYQGVYGHYIVVVGVDSSANTVTVADPDRNVETISYNDLLYGASLISSPSLLLIG